MSKNPNVTAQQGHRMAWTALKKEVGRMKKEDWRLIHVPD